jgi:hypothetical protein
MPDVTADVHADSGCALLSAGEPEAAARQFRAALALDPRHLGACRHLIAALEAQGRREESAGVWLSLGAALDARGRIPESMIAYRECLARCPGSLKAWHRLGVAHLKRRELHDAVRAFNRALELDPQHPATHIDLGRTWHLLGDPIRGWQELAWLCPPAELKWRSFEQPLWQGTPLDGRTLLLWTRPGSGLGDAIQFLRYATHARAHGAVVLVEVQRELVPLVERMEGVHRVVARGEPLPPFDAHAPLPWLPVVLRHELPPYPGDVPYIRIDTSPIDEWRRQLQPYGTHERQCVGLVWSGARGRPDEAARFAPLAAFAPLASVSGVRFISLQLGAPSDQLRRLSNGFRVDRLIDEPQTPLHTAALIMNLDLVITVDTMIAHLAGALARPVWTVLPFAADWRWLSGDTTPWYPTMRLFRQRQPGDWPGVFERVRAALSEDEFRSSTS